MGLHTYQAKRDFKATPEPRGRKGAAKAKGRSFVIQKHAASHLHYDFRLELDGVLLSWAIPKGPSLDPADKRLAVHVEDHPMEYGGFEGVIPKGQYGGGTVMVWDRGTWSPVGEPQDGYRKGRLKFQLQGEKLKGGWNLVRTRGGAFSNRSGDGKRESWLLIKEDDGYARPGEAIVDTAPDSVTSGRSIDDIAGEKSRVWRSDKSVKANVKAGAVAPARKSKPKTELKLSNPDKLLFPEAKLSKRDLAAYYVAIADLILPHIKGRPLSLVRCPDGHHKQCFYQKHASDSVHESVTRVRVPEGGGSAMYFSADNVEALVALVQWGTLELHPWGSRAPDLRHPDRLVFDFDPADDVPWKKVADAARALRGLLEKLGLEGFLKTTGGKGLHVVVPIEPTLTWDQAKGFTKGIADLFARTFPDRFTATVSKAKRKGKIFIDYLRNAEGATSIAPYAFRARENAPVSMPIEWESLGKDQRFDFHNVRNLARKLKARKRDPWTGFDKARRKVTPAMIKSAGGT